MEAFQQFLTDWLTRRQWSVNRLGQEADVSQSLISRWLHSDPRRQITPRPKSLRKLAPVLGVPYEDLMRMCGYLPTAAGQVAPDPIQAELDARLARLSTTLARYPRAFWLAVLESSERMAAVGDAWATAAQPPVSASTEGGLSASRRRLKRGRRAPDDGLSARQDIVGALLAPRFAAAS